MAINYAAKYSDKVDERFKIGAQTTPAVNNEYEFTGVNTVKVYSIPTAPMNDYTMTGTNRYGTPAELQDEVQDLVLSQDRSFTYTIDRRNYTDTMMTKEAGKSLRRQLDEVVIPEVDTYRIAAMIAGAGKIETAAITAANAYASFLDGTSFLADNKVPVVGSLAYVTPHYFKSIKLDDHFIKAGDLSQEMLLKGQVGEIDGIPIIRIPTSYFPANVEFLIANSVATTAPIKLADYKIHDNPPGLNGWLVEGRIYHDAFVLDNKKNALYAHKSA